MQPHRFPSTPAVAGLNPMSPTDILDFWFSQRLQPPWFRSTMELDTEIRQRFGRFPHRNAAFDRETTAEELAWLNSAEDFSG